MGLLIAIVFVATKFINIPGITEGGLFHFGNVAHFTIAIIFGKRRGALSGAMGMALFDILSPWIVWAPFTFIIRLLMGGIIGHVAYMNDKRGRNFAYNIAGIVIATVIMIVGYYIAEGILYGNWIAPVQSIMPNVMQCVVGAAIALPFSTVLANAMKARGVQVESIEF
ncbi:ECF transporter S component [Oceanirhabdus sp. W0125-5]|nr:ECF transporter S component [Oceanirhabdus sp. W0125-5]WBW99739.1 ECF transporter S component [Oceanirhabdus sp. W0125-5]